MWLHHFFLTVNWQSVIEHELIIDKIQLLSYNLIKLE